MVASDESSDEPQIGRQANAFSTHNDKPLIKRLMDPQSHFITS